MPDSAHQIEKHVTKDCLLLCTLNVCCKRLDGGKWHVRERISVNLVHR